MGNVEELATRRHHPLPTPDELADAAELVRAYVEKLDTVAEAEGDTRYPAATRLALVADMIDAEAEALMPWPAGAV